MSDLLPLRCEECRKTCPRTSPTQRFCSKRCRDKNYRKRGGLGGNGYPAHIRRARKAEREAGRPCLACGTHFLPRAINQNYCSGPCREWRNGAAATHIPLSSYNPDEGHDLSLLSPQDLHTYMREQEQQVVARREAGDTTISAARYEAALQFLAKEPPT